MIKENKGVTLVALVITIIVLLILAGISIRFVVGDNGVLSQATNAAEQTNKGTVSDQLNLAVNAVVSDWMNTKYTSGTDQPLWQYINATRLKTNMPEDFEVTECYVNYLYNEEDEITTTYTTTIKYKSEFYYFVLTESLSGNTCLVASADEANSYVAE